MHLILLEYQLEFLITTDLPLVGWVLKVSSFDVLPYLLNDLGSRELQHHVSASVERGLLETYSRFTN